MVFGAVEAPRLDLANEDLVRAHLHSVWLAETGERLGNSLIDLLETDGVEPSLAIKEQLRRGLFASEARRRARARCERILRSIEGELQESDWFHENWLEEEVLAKLERRFDGACERWRVLFRSARATAKAQGDIIVEAYRSSGDVDAAKRLRAEAESQLDLLRAQSDSRYTDFYSYRYFASEGFLPGYNFPRLPLSAFIPARRRAKGTDEFLSRPRFLAISEFGPRAIVYHEGAKYQITRAILPLEDGDVTLSSVKICGECSYLHSGKEGVSRDRCERCDSELGPPMHSLFRLQNVTTRRRERISSDEEERVRYGYEVRTAIRFRSGGIRPSVRRAEVTDGRPVAEILYAQTADLWRVNYGWRQRKNRGEHGFYLDMERGNWEKSPQESKDSAAHDEPLSRSVQRVIPFVEDRRNCLILAPAERLTQEQMATLQAALKVAMERVFQLEDAELAAEPLPSDDQRNQLLFYEAAEGGAGVLSRIALESSLIAKIARVALEICHFDPNSGTDLRRAEKSKEDCNAACYDCLLTYGNQREHSLIDRTTIVEFLLRLAKSEAPTAPGEAPRADHAEQLRRLAGSGLEKEWISFCAERGVRLPDAGQVLLEQAGTRPDFLYQDDYTAIYIDGPPHDFPERQNRDREQEARLRDLGYSVVRFHHKDDWESILRRHHVFRWNEDRKE